jgi:hypothetical protein
MSCSCCREPWPKLTLQTLQSFMQYLHGVVIICGCAAKHAGPTSAKT